MTDKSIVVRSDITAKKSSDMRQVSRKAVAGLSEAELIERNSIGTYKEEDDEDGDGNKKRTKKKD